MRGFSTPFARELLVAVLCSGMPLAAAPATDDTPPTDPAQLQQWIARQRDKAMRQMEQMKKEASSTSPRRRRPLFVVPARNDAEFALLPGPEINPGNLRTEAAHMVKALRGAVDADEIAEADAYLSAAPGNSGALASAAAIGWVSKSPGAALLLAAEAVLADPADDNAVNTLGSLLSLAGYGHKAVPLLRYVAAKHPQDARAHNNLGQAWLTLGEVTEAENELNRCLALAPRFGAAHASLAALAQARGDDAGARSHAEIAAAEDSSPAARQILDEQGVKYALPPSWDRLVTPHEYFSPSHFVPPRPQRHGEEGKLKDRELEAFKNYVWDKKAELEAEAKARQESVQKLLDNPATRLQALTLVVTPVASLSGNALRRIVEARLKDQDLIDDTQRHYRQAVEDLRVQKNQAFQRLRDAHTGDCAQQRAIMDKYLDACADQYEKMEEVVLSCLRHRTNTIMTNLALTSSGPSYQDQFARAAIEYLDGVIQVASMQVIEPYSCEVPMLTGAGQAPSGDLPKLGDCPINISQEVNIGGFKVATLKLNCKNFGFDFKAGLAFSARKDFASGETTLTAGVSEEFSAKGVDLSATGQFVIVWDRNNNLSYAGVELAGGADTHSIAGASGKTSLGVTLGPTGLTPELNGDYEAEVLGRNIFEAKL